MQMGRVRRWSVTLYSLSKADEVISGGPSGMSTCSPTERKSRTEGEEGGTTSTTFKK